MKHIEDFNEFLKAWEKEKEENRARGLCEDCGSHPIVADNLCKECAIPFYIEPTQEDLLEWMGIY